MPTNKSAQNTPEEDDPQAGQDGPFIPDDNSSSESQEEDSRLAEMRQGFEDQQPKNSPFVDTGSLGDLIKKVTDKLKPVSVPTTKILEIPPEPPKTTDTPKEPALPTTRRLFPFDQNEPFPGPSAQPPSVGSDPRGPDSNVAPATPKLSPRPATTNLGPRPAGSTNPLSPKRPGVSTNPLNKLAQKLDSQPGSPLSRLQKSPDRKLLPGRFEKDKQLNYEDELKNPFVNDNDAVEEDVDESLAVKIKNGNLPAETLRLLITSSMSEAEVLAICSELNIDWASVPGETREERTQYLIDYFNKHETHLDYKEVATSLWSQLPSQEQQDWGDTDARLKELQESLTSKEIEHAPELLQEEEKKPSFLERLKDDFAQATPMQKALAIGLSVIVIILIVAIGLVMFPIKMPAAASPRFTASPSDLPSPRALELPGGWTFNLKPGVVQDGSWKPDGAEWLQGTEICRLVSIPWNPQVEAVYSTFQPGDELLLTMTNSELLRYRVTELKTLELIDFNSDDLNQVAKSSSPCLAVVLTRESIETRQMIVAVPVMVAPFQSVITVTPVVTQTLNPAFPTVTDVPTQKP